jgi:hypothetical protein
MYAKQNLSRKRFMSISILGKKKAPSYNYEEELMTDD